MSYQSSPSSAPEQGAHVPYVRAVRAHPLLVVAVAIVAVVAAGVWQKTRSAKYEATAQVLVTPLPNAGPYVGLPVVTESSADPSRTMQTATSVLESPAATLATAHQLGGNWTKKSVGEAVSVQPRGEANVVSITGKAGSGAQAASLANVYARNALTTHVTLLSGEAAIQIKQLQERQKTLSVAEAASSSQISERLVALSSVAAGHDPNFSLLQTAIVPTSASGSSTKLILVLALLAGLLIGVAAAMTIEYLNRRVRDEDEVLSLYPLPVLARVPPLPRGADEVTSPELMPPRIREAFRTLQVQLASSEEGARAIMFTSPSPRDGKTSSAVDFALVLATANRRVILLDFDLRKPDIADRLGAHTDYLDFFRSSAGLDEVLDQSSTTPGLRVLSARPQGDATPLLEAVSRRLPDLLREARELADYVIVDTPPLGQVSDALRAATMVDDIVLVARPGNTDRVELAHTRELLDRMGHTPTGLLLVGVSGGGEDYAGYGYDASVGPGTWSTGDPAETLLDQADDLKHPDRDSEPLTGSGRRRSGQRS
ncbi:MAG: hypothetical protein WB998_07930 [Solirubrobacteraceae bacterium]